MLKRTLNKSFHSSRLSYKHARALLQSNLVSLMLLTLMFLYSNWCYQSLKGRVHSERATASQQRHHDWHATGPAASAGFLFSWGLNAHQRLGRLGNDTAEPQLTLAGLEVVDLAASRHTLLVTRSGTVWSMGANDSKGGGGHGSKALQASGQLGRSGGWAPGQVLGVLQHVKVDRVAAGRYHSAALAKGKVYTWGLNDVGQLGRPARAVLGEGDGLAATALLRNQHNKDDWLPRVGKTLHDASDDGTTAAVGSAVGQAEGSASSDTATPALPGTAERDTQPSKQTVSVADSSSNGNVRCYSGWSCHDGAPAFVEALANTTVVAVKAGRYSTVALDASGQLWVWGYDGCASVGQLPPKEEAWRPRRVQGGLSGKRVVAFDVGYTFWLAATEDGTLYTCDTQDDGYAGTLPAKREPNNAGQLGRSGMPHQPGLVKDGLKGRRVVAVAAGREHAVVATSDGRVWTFGGSVAVLGRTGSNTKPGWVGGALEGQFMRHVAAGEYFSLAASNTQIFGWGSNTYLCTGTGADSGAEVLHPTEIAGRLASGNWSIRTLAAGYQHALAVADPNPMAAVGLRSAYAQDAAPTGAVVGAGLVEVVLTEHQQQAHKRFQDAQREQSARQGSGMSTVQLPAHADAALASVASEQPASAVQENPLSAHVSTAPQRTGSQAATDAQQNAAEATTARSPDAARHHAASAAGSSPMLAAAAQLHISTQTPIISTPQNGSGVDYHWRYLAQQPAPDPGPLQAHHAWAAWKPSPWHDALAALSPDVFALLPKQYNTMHINPCWGGTGPQLACLPYFNIIGVSKCGTTDLYHRLTLYKEAVLPARNKGPHFWDECPYPPLGPCQAGPSGDFQAYINLFSMAADAIRSRPSAITGEASSNTFTSANSIYLRGFKGDKPREQWAGTAGINATMPALLRAAQPYLRLMLMMRNPVARFYSAYYYYRWWLKEDKPPTPDDFHEHAVKELREWKDCVAASSVPDCVRAYRPQQLIKGLYAEFLPDWLNHWPRQQLLLLRYEDYIAAVPQHLKAVLTFLDLPQPEAATFEAMATAEPQNNKTYPPMRADTRQELEAFYAPFNAALATMLGDARWAWTDDQGHVQGIPPSPSAAATPG